MIPALLVGCVVGAALMGRTKPQARSQKKILIGPVTGNTYAVDDFPQAGIIIVHGPGCACAFSRRSGGGFSFVQGLGHPEGIRLVCSDIEPNLLTETK